MLKIILVRHAKAMDRGKAKINHISDKNRPLTPNGVKKFRKFVKLKKKSLDKVNLFATSPFLRANETLDIILKELAVKSAAIKVITEIRPHGNPKYLANWLKKRKEKSILLVSHEPFLSDFLNTVLATDEWTERKINKGAIITNTFNNKNKKFKILSFVSP